MRDVCQGCHSHHHHLGRRRQELEATARQGRIIKEEEGASANLLLALPSSHLHILSKAEFLYIRRAVEMISAFCGKSVDNMVFWCTFSWDSLNTWGTF